MNKLYFTTFKNQPIVILVIGRDTINDTYSGWIFKFDNNGYTKTFDFNLKDFLHFKPIDQFKTDNLKKDFIKWVLFNQENEYKRDEILDALSEVID